jgi:hypothetical protein
VRAASGDDCSAPADEIFTLYLKRFTRNGETTRAALKLLFFMQRGYCGE